MKVLLTVSILILLGPSRSIGFSGVEIPVEGDMVMDCRVIYTDTSTMIWYDTSPQDHVAILNQTEAINRNTKIPGTRYETRINNTVWGVCVIKNVMKGDSTSYRCSDYLIRKHWLFNFRITGPPPVPTAVADNNPVNEGSDVILSCQTTSSVDGTPTYSWKMSGSPVQPGGRISLNPSTGDLRITGVLGSDGGEYVCTVTNVAGTRTSAGLTLQVYYSPDSGPVISGYNNNSSVDACDSITLTCNTNGGNPPANLTWSCNWSGFTDPGPGVGTLDLSLTIEKAYHEQTCTCTAKHPVVNPDQVASRIFNVLYAQGDPALELAAPLPWIENQEYTSTCRSNMGNPPNEYEWYINNMLQVGQETNQFTMTVTKDHNQRTLRCNVKNNYSDRHSQTLKAETLLNVEFSPRVSVGNDIRPTEGDTIDLVCSASSNAIAQADNHRWIHVGGSRTHTGPTWSLGPLDKTYTGTYECQVTVQSAGQHGQLTSNSSLRVTVHYVELSLEQQNLTKTEYDRLKISCSGEGEPPNIQFNMWKYERQGVIRYIPGQVSGTQNRLVIDHVEYTDDGAYTCRGGNTVGQKEIESYVIIHYAPKNADPSSGKQVFTPLGEDVLLTLNVTAVPGSVDFTWRRFGQNGSLIHVHNSNKTMIVNSPLSSRLTISNVTVEDLGNYTVHASNGILNGSDFMYRVSSRGGPSAPYIVEENSVSTPVSVVLSWRANFDGGYTQTFSVHYRETPGGNYILHRGNLPDPGYGKKSEERIGNLNSSTSYQFLVISHNGHNGGTNVSSNEVTIQTLALPLLDQSSLKVEKLEDTPYLSWSQPSGHYDDQRIEQLEIGSNREMRDTGCMPPSCTTYNPGANAANFTVKGLGPEKEYRFVLVLLYLGEVVRRQEFKQQPDPDPIECNSYSAGSLAGIFVAGFVSASVISVFIFLIMNRRCLLKGDTVCKDNTGKNTETGRRPCRDKMPKTDITECSPALAMVDQDNEVIQGQGRENKQSSEHVPNQTAYEPLTTHKNSSPATEGYESLATPGLYENTKQMRQSSEPANTYEELKRI